MHLFINAKRLHGLLLHGPYSWLLIIELLHCGIAPGSQHIRVKRDPSSATSLYYGLNSSYAVSQIMFAGMVRGSGVLLGLLAAGAWFVLSLVVLKSSQTRMTGTLFPALPVGVALTV